MPTVLRSGPYRFYFYSHEPNEPPHVHVDRDDLSARFWLEPVSLARNFGFGARELNTLQSLVEANQERVLEAWYGFLATAADERVADVSIDQDALSVRLKDGRTISAPLAWYPRLFHATPEQHRDWKIAGGGYGIHWPSIDEDISTEGLLRGAPAPVRPAKF